MGDQERDAHREDQAVERHRASQERRAIEGDEREDQMVRAYLPRRPREERQDA